MDAELSTTSSRRSSISTESVTRSLDLINRDEDVNVLAPYSPTLAIPDSPSQSTFLRTAATLDGLARQLEGLQSRNGSVVDLPGGSGKCCCGALQGCRTWEEREKLEDKLKLSGEIGNALLQRYEALEKKLQREVDKYEKLVEVKRTALADSLRHISNLEKANHTHLQKYAEITRKNEALEKRYTQSMHTQTLTQQSLTHVRAELTSLRRTSTRQSIALASGIGVEDRLIEAEKRYENAKEAGEAEARKARDEGRRRVKAEEQIATLEAQLAAAAREVESIKEARNKDAQDLLSNAKARLEILHSELSETFHAEEPSEVPEYQRALESLVANNALLKHDVSELSHTLSDSRDEVRALKEEIDDLRSVVGVAGRVSPSNGPRAPLALELSRSTMSHVRTESSPNVGTFAERGVWGRSTTHKPEGSVSSSRYSGGISAWEHRRKNSMAPSFTSTSTTEGLTSPGGGLGMGPIGEYNAGMSADEYSVAIKSPRSETTSPRLIMRSSPSGGIGYHLNGVPKTKPVLVMPQDRRSFSIERSRPGLRSFTSQGVDGIAEWHPANHRPDSRSQTPEQPPSPGALEYFRASEASRKRASLILQRRQPMSPREAESLSPNTGNMVDQSTGIDFPSPLSDSAINSPAQKRVYRRTLLLLTKSCGVQTDPVEINDSVATGSADMESQPPSVIHSRGGSPMPQVEERSETSSIHENRIGAVTTLVEYLSKILGRIRSSDVKTLNKRLKKQHLPGGDVAHLSRSTMQKLHEEVADLRQQFKSIVEPGPLSRREFTILLKLFKDVFIELVELQNVINDVTIDPSLAKKFQRDAYRDEEDLDADGRPKAPRQSSGLGWIAAPITKFFVTPAHEGGDADPNGSSPRPGRILERGRLQPGPVRAAPKQSASTSATTTHVSVEFGGAGMIRRATPSLPISSGPSQQPIEGLPPSPHGFGDTLSAAQLNRSNTSSSSTAPAAEGGLAPPTSGPRGTLRPSRSRANRNELLGIFAGAPAQVSITGGEPWVIMPSRPSSLANNANPSGRLRAVSSQQFGDQTIRASRENKSRNRLSAIVDAVIDTSAEDIENDSVILSGSYDPPLLERTRRPRGLSDSSIRSTFKSHANPGEGLISGLSTNVVNTTARATAYGSVVTRQPGMLESLSRRLYGFRASSEISPISPDSINVVQTEPMSIQPVTEILKSSPPKPIPTKSQSARSDTVSQPLSSSMTTPSGLFGYIANSLAGGIGESLNTTVEDGDGKDREEEELVGASLRYPALIGRSLSRGPGGKGGWR